jgi:hypothetical protein
MIDKLLGETRGSAVMSDAMIGRRGHNRLLCAGNCAGCAFG